MGIAITLEKYLENNDADFEVIEHPRRIVSSEIAECAHISGESLAKAVLLVTDEGPLLAVLPSTHRLDLAKISHRIGQRLGLATEEDIEKQFSDCDLGAIPACGEAYGLQVLMDEALEDLGDVYFEAGDHERLIHVSGKEFDRIVPNAEHGDYSHHV